MVHLVILVFVTFAWSVQNYWEGQGSLFLAWAFIDIHTLCTYNNMWPVSALSSKDMGQEFLLWNSSSFYWSGLVIMYNIAIEKNTVKPVLSGHSKEDKTKILMTNGSLMKVESIAERSLWSILQHFWPALSNIWSWKLIFGLLFEWPLKTGFTVFCSQYFLSKDMFWLPKRNFILRDVSLSIQNIFFGILKPFLFYS